MAKKFKAVFIMEDGEYKEITYDEFETLETRNRFFVPEGEVILEVSEDNYRKHCQHERKEKYYTERSRKNKDFSYDMLTTDDFNGEDILVSPDESIEDSVEHKMMLEKLRECMLDLSDQEKNLIEALFCFGMSETSYAAICGVSQKMISIRKTEILTKLRKMMGINPEE